VERHGGEVPADLEALTQLPGVGRKTANVVLGVGFGIAEGVVVDTHVKRVAARLGLTREEDPEKVERDLLKLLAGGGPGDLHAPRHRPRARRLHRAHAALRPVHPGGGLPDGAGRAAGRSGGCGLADTRAGEPIHAELEDHKRLAACGVSSWRHGTESGD
jgi:hypothetical protein